MSRLLRQVRAGVFATLLAAGAASGSPERLDVPATPLPAAADRVGFDRGLMILEDAAGEFSVDEVAALDRAGERFEFVPGVPNFGWTRATYWVRLVLLSEAETRWLLEVGWAMVDRVDLYSPLTDRSTAAGIAADTPGGFSRQSAGDSIPHARWSLQELTPTFRVEPPAGEATTYYLRFQGHETMAMPLELWRPEAFAHAEATRNLYFGLYYGALAILALYNLFIFGSIRESSHLAYPVMLAAFALYQACVDGLTFQFLAKLGIHQPAWLLCVLGAVAILMGSQFTKRFFSSRGRVEHRWLTVLEAAVVAVTASLFFGDVMTFQYLISVPAFLAAGSCLTLGFRVRSEGFGPANHYLLGFGTVMVAGIVYEMQGVGLLPSNHFTHNSLRLAMVFTAVTLSLGLADRIRTLQLDLARNERERLETERRAAELEERRRAAEASDLAKSRFLSVASHDLRQPLHALGFFVRSLSEEVKEERAKATVKRLETTVSALSNMLTGLLDMSRIESGKLEPSLANVSLAELLERVRSEFEPEAIERGLTLHLGEADFAVRSDPVLLGRIVQNLVSNAVRYTSSGHVEVSCLASPNAVEIRVADTGPGIAASEQATIFDEFVQLDRHGNGEGLGLGLAIVDRLVKLLGHELRIASNPAGTVFSIVAPRTVAAIPETAEAAFAPRGVEFKGKLAVVIDDDVDVLIGTRELLEGWGLDTVVARDAEDAIEGLAYRDRTPDLILADYRLAQGRNGVDAVSAVRKQVDKDVPAIVVTGESLGEVHARIRAVGLGLMTKPLAPHRLRAVLLQHLRAGSEPLA